MAHRRQEAKIEAERLAEVIRFEIPDIKQLWGFGSVFEKSRPFTKNSDIDFAIEGGNFLTAFKIVERSSFKVDLIDITQKNDSFSAHIREHGKALL